MIPAFKARGSVILTFEGLQASEEMQDIVHAMDSLASAPCIHCRTAKLMAVMDLLGRSPLPDRLTILEQMDMTACACDDPENLVKLVETATELKQKRKFKRANQ
jgi:aerobic-type carbon monoxide dehydrogenase small subunit (CoxS/CutS family)